LDEPYRQRDLCRGRHGSHRDPHAPRRRVFLVEIADNCGGIPSEAQPHIFLVPFFTTKGGSGTGRGLVISHRIVTEAASRKN
jgi:C4-dicarboxylate-specific signal transduction histidine kinase